MLFVLTSSDFLLEMVFGGKKKVPCIAKLIQKPVFWQHQTTFWCKIQLIVLSSMDLKRNIINFTKEDIGFCSFFHGFHFNNHWFGWHLHQSHNKHRFFFLSWFFCLMRFFFFPYGHFFRFLDVFSKQKENKKKSELVDF